MNKKAREQTAVQLEDIARLIRAGRVEWVWIATQYHNGRVTIATKDAPKRPQGMD